MFSTKKPAGILKRRFAKLLGSVHGSERIGFHLNASRWLLFGAITTRALTFIQFAVYARLLSQAEFGTMGVMLSAVASFTGIAGFGLSTYLTQTAAEHVTDIQSLCARWRSAKPLIASFITVASFLYISIAYSTEETTSLVGRVVVVLCIGLSAWNGAQTALLAGIGYFRECALVSLWQSVITTALSIPLAAGLGSLGVVTGFMLGSLVGVFASAKYIAIGLEKKESIPLETPKIVQSPWRIILPAGLVVVTTVPVPWIQLKLIEFAGGGEALANYTVALQIRNAVLLLPQALSVSLMPAIASAAKSITARNMRDEESAIKSVIVTAAAAALAGCLVTPVLVLFYGKRYAGAMFAAMLLSISVSIIGINNVFGARCFAEYKHWDGVFYSITTCIATSLASVIGFSAFGINGMAAAQLFGYCLLLAFLSRYRKTAKCSVDDKS